MFRSPAMVLVVLAGLWLLMARVAHADVFDMLNGEAGVQFAALGSPNNLPDPATGSLDGSVGYTRQTGKYDVAVGQYCEFLNAVAATDTYGLYNSDMGGADDYSTNLGEAAGSTETGTYTLNATTSESALMTLSPRRTNGTERLISTRAAAPTGPTRPRAILRRATCSWPRERTRRTSRSTPSVPTRIP